MNFEKILQSLVDEKKNNNISSKNIASFNNNNTLTLLGT